MAHFELVGSFEKACICDDINTVSKLTEDGFPTYMYIVSILRTIVLYDCPKLFDYIVKYVNGHLLKESITPPVWRTYVDNYTYYLKTKRGIYGDTHRILIPLWHRIAKYDAFSYLVDQNGIDYLKLLAPEERDKVLKYLSLSIQNIFDPYGRFKIGPHDTKYEFSYNYVEMCRNNNALFCKRYFSFVTLGYISRDFFWEPKLKRKIRQRWEKSYIVEALINSVKGNNDELVDFNIEILRRFHVNLSKEEIINKYTEHTDLDQLLHDYIYHDWMPYMEKYATFDTTTKSLIKVYRAIDSVRKNRDNPKRCYILCVERYVTFIFYLFSLGMRENEFEEIFALSENDKHYLLVKAHFRDVDLRRIILEMPIMCRDVRLIVTSYAQEDIYLSY
jgi:hypothetical protein